MIKDKIKEDNYRVFALVSDYLNNASDYIKKEDVEEIVKCGVSSEYAFALILAAAFKLEIEENIEDRDLFRNYFVKMVHKLDPNEYCHNPYYQNIKISTVKAGSSELRYETYKPFLFVMTSSKPRRADKFRRSAFLRPNSSSR